MGQFLSNRGLQRRNLVPVNLPKAFELAARLNTDLSAS